MIEKLRQKVKGEELTYQFLIDFLCDYKKPRDKISRWLAEGALIRVKKGLYVFGPDWQRRPISREVLANMIYGPSAISLEYALAHYGLIPERVESVTSITTGKTKGFDTPFGTYTYRRVPQDLYSRGIRREPFDDDRYFLIVSPERALVDTLSAAAPFASLVEIEEYLFENLRVDRGEYQQLSKDELAQIGTELAMQLHQVIGQ